MTLEELINKYGDEIIECTKYSACIHFNKHSVKLGRVRCKYENECNVISMPDLIIYLGYEGMLFNDKEYTYKELEKLYKTYKVRNKLNAS